MHTQVLDSLIDNHMAIGCFHAFGKLSIHFVPFAFFCVLRKENLKSILLSYSFSVTSFLATPISQFIYFGGGISLFCDFFTEKNLKKRWFFSVKCVFPAKTISTCVGLKN
jgi:hypothetical protein